MENKPESFNDEIDLRDCINVLIKRKVAILAVFLVFIVAAAVYSFNAPKVYLAEKTISIAKIEKPLISPQEAVQVFFGRQILSSAVDKLPDLSIKQLKDNLKVTALKDTNFISLALEHRNRHQATKILQEITENFINQFGGKYQQRIDLIENQIEVITAQKKEIEKQVAALKSRNEEENFGAYALAQNAVSNYQKIYARLTGEIFRLKEELAQSEGYAIAEPAAITKDPLRPKPILNIVIAAMLGLIFGVFTAFSWEFWKNRQE